MHRNKSVNVHQFAMIPRADIPRSSFRMQKAYKTTFGGVDVSNGTPEASDKSFLIPVLVEEVLPGDTWNLRMTAFCRLATPLFPIMDNAYLDSFFFFVPNRLVWDNWQKFMGERSPNPNSSIDYTLPQIGTSSGGHALFSIYDYMGLPTAGQVVPGATTLHHTLPLRAYNLIWNEWFRDQNLVGEATVLKDDGPDPVSTYKLLPRMKRHDYFTGCLPWPQKGDPVTISLTGDAPVVPVTPTIAPTWLSSGTNEERNLIATSTDDHAYFGIGNVATALGSGGAQSMRWGEPNLQADLTDVTAATINQLREAFQIQKMLERDARGGTRYTEIIRSQFGVVSPDARLQRPEYIGGGTSPIAINPIAQTSATSITDSDTPLGNLAAMGTAVLSGHGFTQSFVEHGYVIGLINVRADLTYQQGMRRHWSRLTRYDYYTPVFAMLGEQAVLSKEIYFTGEADDNDVFGYQERWGEYRYLQSEITGLFRSTAANTIDPWHLSQNFDSRPVLNNEFIADAPPISRITAVGAAAMGQQFLCDAFFDVKAARPMPMYSVPGLIDHF